MECELVALNKDILLQSETGTIKTFCQNFTEKLSSTRASKVEPMVMHLNMLKTQKWGQLVMILLEKSMLFYLQSLLVRFNDFDNIFLLLDKHFFICNHDIDL
jgi:hypothetical protein